jgi:hypothetical protein
MHLMLMHHTSDVERRSTAPVTGSTGLFSPVISFLIDERLMPLGCRPQRSYYDFAEYLGHRLAGDTMRATHPTMGISCPIRSTVAIFSAVPHLRSPRV